MCRVTWRCLVDVRCTITCIVGVYVNPCIADVYDLSKNICLCIVDVYGHGEMYSGA